MFVFVRYSDLTSVVENVMSCSDPIPLLGSDPIHVSPDLIPVLGPDLIPYFRSFPDSAH